jgi:C4-dicarboxylate-binding protein DctP
MKKIIRCSLVLGLVLMLAAFAAGCGGNDSASGGDVIEIKFSHVVGPETPKGLAAQKFADLAAEKTDGKVKVKVYPSSQLYGDKDELEALQVNNVQMIAPSAGKMVAIDPRFQLPDLPFLFNDEAASNRFWDGPGGQQLFAGLESNGILGLTSWPNGMRHWINGKREIHTPADMQGLKFRIPSGGVLTKMHEHLGAGAVGIAFGEVYTALQQGTIDGTVASLDNIKTERYYETIKELTIANINSLNYVVLVNAEFWKGLPDDIRTALEEAMAEATEYERQLSLEKNSLAEGSEVGTLFAEANVNVTELTDEQKQAFRDALQALYDEFAPVIGEDIIKLALEANE